MNLVVLIPAYNEETAMSSTLTALMSQKRLADKVVVIPNGCSDGTASEARKFPVTVMELPKLEHKKSEALNRAWFEHCQDADIVICLDADTVLPSNALQDWEREMQESPILGGSSSKFTMLGGNFWTRLQRAEFAKWTSTALVRGKTSILAGTGCAIRNECLREIVATRPNVGPWSYSSQVEDFELTYRIRKAGWHCQVSPTVRAYTDSMTSVKALWGQRMKWQVGTVEDLMDIGVNRLTLFDWYQQVSGILMASLRILWAVCLVLVLVVGQVSFDPVFMLTVPILFATMELINAFRIPHRDRVDILVSATIIPSEIFAWLRSAWFLAAWAEVVAGKFTGKRKDRWELQYVAEGQ